MGHPEPGIPLCAAISKKIWEYGPRMVDVGGLYSLMNDAKMKEKYTAGANTALGVGISVAGDVGSVSPSSLHPSTNAA
jgi:hypothetical protein